MFFYVWEDAGAWDYWNHSFHMHLSYLGPESCFFQSLTSPSPHPASQQAPCGGGRHLLDHRYCFPFWEPSLTFGGWKLLKAVTSLLTDTAGDIPLHNLLQRADSLGRDPCAGKDWGQEDKEKMVRQHHRVNGHKFEQTLGESEGQGSLACCSQGSQRIGQDLGTEQQ